MSDNGVNAKLAGYVTSHSSDSEDSSDDESWDDASREEEKTPAVKSKEDELADVRISKQLEALALNDFRLLAESNKQVAESNKEVAESNKQVAHALTEQSVLSKNNLQVEEAAKEVTGHASKTATATRKLEKENKWLKHENESLKDDLIRSLRNNCGIEQKHATNNSDDRHRDDDENIKEFVTGAMLKKNTGVTLFDVAGLDQAKATLEEALILPIEHPELFTGGRKPYNNIMFYGPPGTGKTRLAKAVATETDSIFFSISPSVIASKWYGESERIINALFETARDSNENRVVIFIDEMDALCGSRGDLSDTIPRNIVSELLLQIDGMATGEDDNLVLIGATNRPWDIDPAILQRMEKRIYIPLPTKSARIEIIQIHLNGSKTTLKATDYDKLGDLTDGASGRDMKNLVKRALMEPVRRCNEAERFHSVGNFYMPCIDSSNCKRCLCCKQCRKSKGDSCRSCGTKFWKMGDFVAGMLKVQHLCMMDFEAALENWRTTVKEGDLDEYFQWTNKFGENGV